MLKRFREAWNITKEMENMEKKSITPMATLPSYQSKKAIWKDWTTDNAVNYGYKASTWVYSCISRISKTASSVPWKVYRETESGLEEVPNHPLEQLIKRPNPYMSGQDMLERLVTHLYLGGNGIVSKVRANNIVAELWPVAPDGVSPIPSKQEFIDGYQYRQNGINYTIPSEDIVHMMFIDPSNVYWGMAPLQAVARSVDTDSEMVDWQKVSLQNRAITDGVFSFKQPLTTEQWDDARQMVRDQHQGPSNARTPWVLGGDASWQQMSMSPAEMDFIESRRFSREEICSVFNVPPPMVGLYENATLANIETARKIFWLDTVIPLLDDLKSSLNIALTREFGEGIILSYDVSNVQAIQDNYDEKVQTAERLWKMGVPFNTVNQRLELGFDDIETGDVSYLPTNVIDPNEPTADVNVNPNGNQDENEEEEPQVAGYKPRGKKAWNLESEEQKELFWKNTEQRRNKWEDVFMEKAEELFQDEADSVVKSFRDNGTSDAFGSIDAKSEEWNQLFRAMYIAIVEEFGEETWDTLKSHHPSHRKDFDPWDENIQLWILNRAADKIRGILDTTKDLVRNVIALGQENRRTVDQIARDIREKYNGFSRRRSEVIARTETVASSNYGSMESARQTGLPVKKVWVSSRDIRVRDTHEKIDGTMVDMDDEFHVGGDTMAHPGGGSLAKENVNCRCVLSYRTIRN